MTNCKHATLTPLIVQANSLASTLNIQEFTLYCVQLLATIKKRCVKLKTLMRCPWCGVLSLVRVTCACFVLALELVCGWVLLLLLDFYFLFAL